jgi:hypothetical protein
VHERCIHLSRRGVPELKLAMGRDQSSNTCYTSRNDATRMEESGIEYIINIEKAILQVCDLIYR